MLRFFLSIKTSLWLTGISIAVFLAGSFYIPQNLDVFSEINDMPLFRWFSENFADFDKFFWIYLLIGLMTLFGINMFVCSIDAVVRKTTWKRLVEVLSPQLLHVGVIFVLLGQLISASTGYKQDVPMDMNDTMEIKGFNMTLSNMEFFKKQGEDSTRWRVYLTVDNKMHMLEPAKPAFYKGVGFFVKSAEHRRMKAIIGLVYDPGVMWEIIGAIALVVGAAGIYYVRFSKKQLNTE